MDIWDRANRARVAGDLEGAAALYRQMHSAPPMHHHLGIVLAALGRVEEAAHHYRATLRLDPDYVVAEHSLSLLLLSLGRYQEAWPLYEARRRIPELGTLAPVLPYPEWRGEPLAGKRIVVFGEQGLGDQIMFARFLEPLRRVGAEVVFICAPPLAPLFPGSLSLSAGQAPRADYWALIGSLPLRLGVTLDTLPPPVTFDVPVSSGGGTGVNCEGGAAFPLNAQRSLWGTEAMHLRALGRDISPEATGARDMLETARLLAPLDRIISVCTANAHLAASLSKPTWVLLMPRFADWRWGRSGEASPWYPSVKLYRAGDLGWPAVLDQVEADLASLEGSHEPDHEATANASA
jgi:hypothetical protein